MSLFKALLTCRGRVCLPENTRVDKWVHSGVCNTSYNNYFNLCNLW